MSYRLFEDKDRPERNPFFVRVGMRMANAVAFAYTKLLFIRTADN